jgi:2-octaprenylphenol hydroxylase
MRRGAADTDFDCLIIGSGVIGTTMASLLIARRLVARGRVAIVADRSRPAAAPQSDWDLRVFALSRASQRVLDICSVWRALPAQRQFPYERMCVWDEHGAARGRGALTFDCAELGEPNLGYIVDGAALQLQCTRSAVAAGVVLIETGLEDLRFDAACVRAILSDGREVSARAMLAADGTESKARALLGIESAGHSYQQDALVAHVRTAEPHENTAWQRFLRTGPLAFLPLPDGRSSIVWTVKRAEADRLRALDAGAFDAALTQASGGVLGACESTTPLASFPLKLEYALDYVRPRAVLLGDAAHVVHPMAGQGLNLGLLDCASLASVWEEAGGGDVFGEQAPLRRYERWRRGENLLAASALDGLERLFGSDNPALSRLRVFGLDAVGRLPFIKRQLARRAMGLAGDVPEFLNSQ